MSEGAYRQLVDLAVRLARAPPAAGGVSIGEGAVVKEVQNIHTTESHTTEGRASVGSIHINVPQAQSTAPAVPGLVECPLCGRHNELKGTFRCRQCGTSHLCLEHFVREARMCEECVEKDAEARRRLEEERMRQEAALKAAQAPPTPPKPALQVYTGWPFDAVEAKRRQEETAAALGVPVEKQFDLGGGMKLTMIPVPAGEFDMGSPPSEEGRSDNESLHRVRIEAPFCIGKYPVTQEQWQAVMGKNPSHFKGPKNPVEQVTWRNGVSLADELASRFPAAAFALPTDAQWEYACRAGSKARFCFEASDGNLGHYAWYEANSDKQTHPVGEKRPNAWGLHDVHGNVWEWTASPFSEEYDGSEMLGADEGGGDRVWRGGAWSDGPGNVRSARRHGAPPAAAYGLFGVRLVCRPQE